MILEEGGNKTVDSVGACMVWVLYALLDGCMAVGVGQCVSNQVLRYQTQSFNTVWGERGWVQAVFSALYAKRKSRMLDIAFDEQCRYLRDGGLLLKPNFYPGSFYLMKRLAGVSFLGMTQVTAASCILFVTVEHVMAKEKAGSMTEVGT
jgi:hypothetical protein